MQLSLGLVGVEHTAPQGAGLSPPSTTRGIVCCSSHRLPFPGAASIIQHCPSPSSSQGVRPSPGGAEVVLRTGSSLTEASTGSFFPQDAFLPCCASSAVCLLFLPVTQGPCCGMTSSGGRLSRVVRHAQAGCGVVLSSARGSGWAPRGILSNCCVETASLSCWRKSMQAEQPLGGDGCMTGL